MTRKPKATQGTVIHKIKDQSVLSSWADELSKTDFFKSASLSKELVQKIWTEQQSALHFFTANNPKNAQAPTFEDQYGLLIFSDQKAQDTLRALFSIDTTLAVDGGLIVNAFAREGHKTTVKYMLLAAERIVHEKQNQIYCLVLEGDASLMRFVRSSGYEETAKLESKANSTLKAVLFHKLLTS